MALEKSERVQLQLGGYEMFDPYDHCCRDFDDMKGFVNAISRSFKVMSWGASKWSSYGNKCLRFKVNGHHFKGFVWVVVNFSDYFDIFYTDKNGLVKDYVNDICITDFIDTIDKRVEYIPEYFR